MNPLSRISIHHVIAHRAHSYRHETTIIEAMHLCGYAVERLLVRRLQETWQSLVET
jgi:hypothetical protein